MGLAALGSATFATTLTLALALALALALPAPWTRDRSVPGLATVMAAPQRAQHGETKAQLIV